MSGHLSKASQGVSGSSPGATPETAGRHTSPKKQKQKQKQPQAMVPGLRFRLGDPIDSAAAQDICENEGYKEEVEEELPFPRRAKKVYDTSVMNERTRRMRDETVRAAVTMNSTLDYNNEEDNPRASQRHTSDRCSAREHSPSSAREERRRGRKKIRDEAIRRVDAINLALNYGGEGRYVVTPLESLQQFSVDSRYPVIEENGVKFYDIRGDMVSLLTLLKNVQANTHYSWTSYASTSLTMIARLWDVVLAIWWS